MRSKQGSNSVIWLQMVLACVMQLIGASLAVAGNYPVVKATIPVKKIPTWNIEIQHDGIQGDAYYGIRVKINSLLGAVTRNERFRVEITSNNNWNKNYDEQVTTYLEMGEGGTATSQVIDVPQRQLLATCSVVIYHENIQIFQTSLSFPNVNQNNGRQPETLGVLVIDQDMPTPDVLDTWRGRYFSKGSPFFETKNLPDIRQLMVLFPSEFNLRVQWDDETKLPSATDADLINTFENHPHVRFAGLNDLASRWLSLSNADLVLISWSDLKTLQKNEPESFTALAQLCMAGSCLIITGLESESVHTTLPQIDQLFASGEQPSPPMVWREPQTTSHFWNNRVIGLNYVNNVNNYNWQQMQNNANRTPQNEYESFAVSNPAVPQEIPFHFRSLGFGGMAAWHGDTPLPTKMHEWGWVLNSMEFSRVSWERRLGMSHRETNRDYWNFLIPGIGQAPVYSFMGMIGLFMLVIGPVNYYFLRRVNRLALLLVTVPLGATLFTLGLVLFALFSDGFTTRARLRSLTVLEQGRASCISRQTYFAAFVPSEGVQFPAETAAYCLHHQPWLHATGYQNQFFNSNSLITNEKLYLRSRYLGAREQRQFMVQRSAPCAATLKVVRDAQAVDKQSSPQITVENRLGVQVDMCFLHDEERKVYLVSNLAPGARQTVASLDEEQLRAARVDWQTKLRHNELSTPVSYDRLIGNDRWNRRRYYYGNQPNTTAASQNLGLLEVGAGQMQQASYSRPQDAPVTKAKFTPRFYAIVSGTLVDDREQPLTPLGISAARVVLESHLVQGSW